MTTIAVIAGLGNPGAPYHGTRHNIGFDVIDALATRGAVSMQMEKRFKAEVGRWLCNGKPVWLLKPQTFVNVSGESLGAFARFYDLRPEQVALVYDDINLEPGRLKISAA